MSMAAPTSLLRPRSAGPPIGNMVKMRCSEVTHIRRAATEAAVGAGTSIAVAAGAANVQTLNIPASAHGSSEMVADK